MVRLFTVLMMIGWEDESCSEHEECRKKEGTEEGGDNDQQG